jgi:hypothetical protein
MDARDERGHDESQGVPVVIGLEHDPLSGSCSSPRKPFRRDQARSKRSAFITLSQAATKSFANFAFESAHA